MSGPICKKTERERQRHCLRRCCCRPPWYGLVWHAGVHKNKRKCGSQKDCQGRRKGTDREWSGEKAMRVSSLLRGPTANTKMSSNLITHLTAKIRRHGGLALLQNYRTLERKGREPDDGEGITDFISPGPSNLKRGISEQGRRNCTPLFLSSLSLSYRFGDHEQR